MSTNIIALFFLFVGGGFVATLLLSIIKMLGHNWDSDQALSSVIFKLFAWPIILAIVIIIFCVFVLPKLQ